MNSLNQHLISVTLSTGNTREFTPATKLAAENLQGGLLQGRIFDLKRWAAVEAAEAARRVALEIEGAQSQPPFSWAEFVAGKASRAGEVALAAAEEAVAANLPDDIRYSEMRAKCYFTLKAAADLADEGAAILRERIEMRRS